MASRGLSEQNILDAILELESEEEDNLELELCNFDEDSWDSVADPEYQPEPEELNYVEENLIHGIINAEEAEKEEREQTPGSSKRKKQKLIEGRRNERSAAQEIRETEEVITIITPSTNNQSGKDGNFIWSKEPVAALGHIRPGPTANAKNSLCPASCFKPFFFRRHIERDFGLYK
ncbi:uncharacterized protein LOC128855910 [Anastrepha ludens]|uniref:uncharacterized protein LOC128855910 n=1 Tax=Anastrepha ludens TaxID=28586 RepID=UPI0023AF4F3F|nr:uncharacterized protein LOC128855910 [Anastrepha ludens]